MTSPKVNIPILRTVLDCIRCSCSASFLSRCSNRTSHLVTMTWRILVVT